jgi:hypothetical protein
MRILTEQDTTQLRELYDPLILPPDLRKAHGTLDSFYREHLFASKNDRVAHFLTVSTTDCGRVIAWMRIEKH